MLQGCKAYWLILMEKKRKKSDFFSIKRMHFHILCVELVIIDYGCDTLANSPYARNGRYDIRFFLIAFWFKALGIFCFQTHRILEFGNHNHWFWDLQLKLTDWLVLEYEQRWTMTKDFSKIFIVIPSVYSEFTILYLSM